jgi:hypothetical protein
MIGGAVPDPTNRRSLIRGVGTLQQNFAVHQFPRDRVSVQMVKQTRCRRRFPHVKKGARSRPAVFTARDPISVGAHPVEGQHHNSFDFAGLLNRCPATAAASNRWRNRAESGQRDRDLWPRGNTAPETTLLSGYGVDTLRWADNVAAPGAAEVATPASFKGG